MNFHESLAQKEKNMKTTKMISKIAGVILAGLIAVSFAGCKEKGAETSSKGGASNIEKLKAGTPAPESDFEVKLLEDGRGCLITQYKGKAKNLVVPQTIQGKQVIGVSLDAWEPNKSTETVVFPEGMLELRSIYQLNNLKTIVLPSTVRYFGGVAYTKLTHIDLPDYVTLGERALNQFKSVTLPEHVAFTACEDCLGYELEDVTVPENISAVLFDNATPWQNNLYAYFDNEQIKQNFALVEKLKKIPVKQCLYDCDEQYAYDYDELCKFIEEGYYIPLKKSDYLF